MTAPRRSVTRANDLAREYAIPSTIELAARRIAEREPRSIDLVEVDGQIFCGVGGLALVARAALAVTRVKQLGGIARRVADLLGRQVYRISATAALLGTWRIDERVRIDYLDAERGDRLQFETFASAVFVTNHRTLGGGMVLPVDAKPADGVLELCWVPSRPRHSLMLNFARLSAGSPTIPCTPIAATSKTWNASSSARAAARSPALRPKTSANTSSHNPVITSPRAPSRADSRRSACSCVTSPPTGTTAAPFCSNWNAPSPNVRCRRC